MPSKFFAIDASTGLIKRALAQAAVTTSGFVGVQHDQGAAAITDLIAIIQIEAIDVASTDEVYTFRVVGSNVADRSDGQTLAMIDVRASSLATLQTVVGAAGQQLQLRCRTERDETAFRYVDLHLAVAGTTPSITFGAYLSKELC